MRRPFLAAFLALLSGCNQEPEAPPAPVTAKFDADPASLEYIDPAKVPELQAMATEACLCTRSKGFEQKDACWSDFWTIANKYHNTSAASACGPGSSAYVEFSRKSERTLTEMEPAFGAGDGSMMVSTAWGYEACSARELPSKKREFEQKSSMRGC